MFSQSFPFIAGRLQIGGRHNSLASLRSSSFLAARKETCTALLEYTVRPFIKGMFPIASRYIDIPTLLGLKADNFPPAAQFSSPDAFANVCAFYRECVRLHLQACVPSAARWLLTDGVFVPTGATIADVRAQIAHEEITGECGNPGAHTPALLDFLEFSDFLRRMREPSSLDAPLPITALRSLARCAVWRALLDQYSNESGRSRCAIQHIMFELHLAPLLVNFLLFA